MPRPSKDSMIDFLSGRAHSHGYDHYPFCWNIKYHFIASEDGMTSKIDGKTISLGRVRKHDETEWRELVNNPAFNDMWSWYVGEHWGEIFDMVSEDILSFAGTHNDWYFFEGFADSDLDELKDYQFHTFGRMSGWLVLSKWDGISLYRTFFDSLALEEWTWKDVHVLYKAVKKVDEWKAELPRAVEHGFAFRRSIKEGEWEEEIAEQVSDYLMDVSRNVETGDLRTVTDIHNDLGECIKESWADMEDGWGKSAKAYVEAEFARQANELMPEWVRIIAELNCAREETFGAFAPIGGTQ